MVDLGNRLKEARKAKGLSLDDLHKITKVKKNYLASIEEGNYNNLPGLFYIKAFIKLYADAVGLNLDELLETHKLEVPSSTNQTVRQTMVTPPARSWSFLKNPNRFKRWSSTKNSNNISSEEVAQMISVALFIIIGIAICWFFYQNLARNDNPAESGIQVPFLKEKPLITYNIPK